MEIEQKRFRIKEGIENIMPFPKSDTVCTNSLDNALTSMSLEDGTNIKYTVEAKDFMRYVSTGAFQSLPLFPDGVIGWVKQRMVVLYDTKSRQHVQHMICEDLEAYIMEAYKTRPDTVLFEICRSEVTATPTYTLRQVRMDPQAMQNIKEIKITEDQDVFVTSGHVFLIGDQKFLAYTWDLGPIDHPMTTFLANQKHTEGYEVDELVDHPSLPFAVIIEDGIPFVIDWRSAIRKTQSLPEESFGYDFSPDHSRLLYWKSDDDMAQLFAMKVNPKSLNFLDAPILLGTLSEVPDPNAKTWIPEPMSYVVIDTERQELMSWNFNPR